MFGTIPRAGTGLHLCGCACPLARIQRPGRHREIGVPSRLELNDIAQDQQHIASLACLPFNHELTWCDRSSLFHTVRFPPYHPLRPPSSGNLHPTLAPPSTLIYDVSSRRFVCAPYAGYHGFGLKRWQYHHDEHGL